MLFNEDDAGPLKRWIVRRLEDMQVSYPTESWALYPEILLTALSLHRSDADSDVLADYVLALLRHDQPVEEVRKLCIDQLEDFLKDHTATFVNDIFGIIASKSYLPPGSGLSARPATSPNIFSPPAGSATTSLGPGSSPTNVGPLSRDQSRKRSYHDHEGSEPWDGKDPHYGRASGGDRAFKQPRRGNTRGGRFDGFGNRARQGPQQLPTPDATMANLGGMPQQPPIGFPGLPQPPSAFFDPNDPMAAFLAMQAMGFPLPTIPFAPVGSPSSFAPNGNQQSPILDAAPPVKRIGERCRDYDEKGFCALGSTCPYEHGTNPIVVPGDGDGESTLQAGLEVNLIWGQEYDPNNSALVTDIKKPMNASGSSANGSSHRDSNRGSDRGGRGRGRGGSTAPVTRRGGRAEFSHAGPNQDRSITTVVVESIPEDKFQEETVREFFSTFGNIQDIQMQGYKRLALVKYDDWTSAKRAYDSPKVIFDNRFVKVYWYKPESVPKPPVAANGTAKAGSPTPSKKASEGEMEIDMEDFKKRQEEAQKTHDEKMRKKKETEDAKRELEKRREELLKNQAEEKRKLMERLAAKTTGKGKAVSNSPPAPGTPKIENGTNGATTNGDVKANQAKTSSQTEALRAQLAALEAEARSLGIDSTLSDDGLSTRGRGRGRGAFRGRGGYMPRGHGGYESFRGGYRGRGGPFAARGRGGTMKLDNRTKKVTVSGTPFDSNKDESLRQYLLGIGEFENIEHNPNRSDSQIITFKDRFTAEKFIHSGSEIPGVGKVELSWVNTPLPPVVVNKQPQHETSTPVSSATASHDGDTAMADGDMHKTAEDYDVAEDDDDRWMVQ